MHEIPESYVATYADIVSDKFDLSELTLEQRAFAIEYVTNGYNHRAAAKSIGVRGKTAGLRLKRTPIVVEFIIQLQNRELTASVVTKQVLEGMLDRIEEAAMGDIKIPIVLNNGAMVMQKKFHGALALDVYREKAKLHDIIKPDSQSQEIFINVVPNDRSDDDLEINEDE